MKNLLFLLSTFLITVARCFSSQDTTSPLKIEVKIVKEYEVNLSAVVHAYGDHKDEYAVTADSVIEKRWDVDIMVTNTGKYTVTNYQYTCSWSSSFEFSNRYIYFLGWPCDQNICCIPVSYNPGESKLYQATIRKRRSLKDSCKSCYLNPPQELETKIGLISFINGNEQSVIWSNPVYLFKKDRINRTLAPFKNEDNKLNIKDTFCVRKDEPGTIKEVGLEIKLKKAYTVLIPKEQYKDLYWYRIRCSIVPDSIPEKRYEVQVTLTNNATQSMQFSFKPNSDLKGKWKALGASLGNNYFTSNGNYYIFENPWKDSSLVLQPGEQRWVDIVLKNTFFVDCAQNATYNVGHYRNGEILIDNLQLGLTIRQNIFTGEPLYDNNRKIVWSNPLGKSK